MFIAKELLCSLAVAALTATVQVEPSAESVEILQATVQPPELLPLAPIISPLPAGTPVLVALDAELSTQTSLLGDSFSVTVVQDVMQNDVIVIPKGTRGRGEVTFVTKKGGFGKPGIIGIALRDMDLNGKQVTLDGRFREEGGNNNAATAATMFAVGIVAGLVKGKTGVIPAGRELKGRTGEEIPVTAVIPAPPVLETAPTDKALDGPNTEPRLQVEQTEATGGSI